MGLISRVSSRTYRDLTHMAGKDPLILLCNQITPRNYNEISQKLQAFQMHDYIRVLHNLTCEEPSYTSVIVKTITAIDNVSDVQKYDVFTSRIKEVIRCGLDQADTEWIQPWIRLGIVPAHQDEDRIDKALR